MKDNGHKTETPDVSHIRNVEVTHETSDINVLGVLQFVAALTVVTIGVFFAMILLFKFLDKKAAEPEPGPMVLRDKGAHLPPEPRLQSAPGFGVTLEDGKKVELEKSAPDREYKVVLEQWDEALKGKLIDHSGNQVFKPIDQAIDELVSSGVSAKPPQGATKLDDVAVTTPTAQSSGRVEEKRISGKQ